VQEHIRSDPAYGELRARRKIDHFNVVTASFPAELSNASDFSRSSVDERIQAGQRLSYIDSKQLVTEANSPV